MPQDSEANVPEKLIKEVTGHRSSDSLCVYERTSISQQQAVSTLMCGQSRQSYQEAVISEPVLQQSKTEKPVLGESSFPNMFQNCNNCTINVSFSNK